MDRLELLGRRLMGCARDRELVVGKDAVLGHGQRLEGFRAGTHECDRAGVAGCVHDRHAPDGDRVHAVPRLEDGAPLDDYADGVRHGRNLMPEFPEIEALRRSLDEAVRVAPIEQAGPAHVATLKTFDPPLSELAGRRFAGARRRGKHLLFPTDDGDLVLHVHLMSAGRLSFSPAGEKRPKAPAFQLMFTGGDALVLTEAGAKKRAKVGLFRPEAIEEEFAHLGPEAVGLGAERLGEILRADSRRLHPFLRDQRALAGIGRAWTNEILHRARLSPYALSTDLSDAEIERLAAAIDEVLAEGLDLRERGVGDAKAFGIHKRLGEPCPVCGTPIAQVDFEEHTDLLLPRVPDRRPDPQGPATLAPAPLSRNPAAGRW